MKSPKFIHSSNMEPSRASKPEYFNLPSKSRQQMTKVKNMIKSPLSKRKQEGNFNPMKSFGVSLEELLKRNPEDSEIPKVLRRITDFIKNHGMRHEGIFRVNGNVKVMERLKAEFDRGGDADLEESGDIMSVAGLMKMFLRELPDPLIPNHFKTPFIQVHKDYHMDRPECCLRMRKLAGELPEINKRLLKFICTFLVQISLNKDANKMNPNALAIVFAPNIFRCADGFEGIKEQAATNNIVCMLIEEYDSIFKGENEESPFLINCIQVQAAKDNNFTCPPATPIPYQQHKKGKQRKEKLGRSLEQSEVISPYAEFRVVEHDRLVMNGEPKGKQEHHIYASVSKAQRDAILGSTMFEHSVDETEPYIRCNSPCWHKPNGEPSSPKLGSSPKSRKEYMERTIKESINELLFGHNLTSTSEESDKWDSPGEEAPPVPPKSANLLVLDETAVKSQKRKKRRGSKSSQETIKVLSSDVDLTDGVDQSTETRHKHKSDQELDQTSARSAKRVHRSKQQDMENINRQPIVNVVDYDSTKSEKMCTSSNEEVYTLENVDLSNIERPQEVLSCLTLNRAPPPRKRRPPSLHKSLPAKIDFRVTDLDVKADLKSLPRKPPSPPPRSVLSPSNSISPSAASKVERRKQVRSMPEFPRSASERDEVDSEGSSCASDDTPVTFVKSKKSDRIPIMPPLELYKLAEMTEDDPMISPRERYDGTGFDDTMVSPRSRRATLDIRGFSTECPPSPPASQENHFWLEKKQNTSPKGDASMKELTKRMQSLKKKIKEFEEKFEDEHGYKPTSSQDKGPIKKYISELGRTRKLIQEIKEKRNQGERSSSGETSPQAFTANKTSEFLLTTVAGTVEQSLQGSLNKLKDKRESNGRPDNIEEMSHDQLQDEKLAIQKVLLQHENTFGRPTSKRDKDVMKPLYDRYRTIKRKISSFNAKEVTGLAPSSKSLRNRESRKQSPERSIDLDVTTVTQDTSLLGFPSCVDQRLTQSLPAPNAKDKGLKLFENDISPISPLSICVDEPEEDTTINLEDAEYQGIEDSATTASGHSLLTTKDSDAILHQASMPELLEQQTSALKRKKKLRKKLKAFEDNFAKKTGRKVQKEDRGSHEEDYEEYKKLKARLRLLDALITKQQGNNTI